MYYVWAPIRYFQEREEAVEVRVNTNWANLPPGRASRSRHTLTQESDVSRIEAISNNLAAEYNEALVHDQLDVRTAELNDHPHWMNPISDDPGVMPTALRMRGPLDEPDEALTLPIYPGDDAQHSGAHRGHIKFYYFYFGDLLEIVLDTLKDDRNPALDRDLENLKIVLGTILMERPTPSERPDREGHWSKSHAIINMADVPISLNMFLTFWTQRTAGRDQSRWLLRDFIKDIFTILVYPMLGQGCAERSRRRRPRANFTVTPISAYADEEGNDRLARTTETNAPGRHLDTVAGGQAHYYHRVFDTGIPSLVTDDPMLVQNRRLYNYLIIQSTEFATFGRNSTDVNAQYRDNQDGIYWLNIGNPKGIVKSIKFKKTDLPGLREARMEREGTIGLGQLRDKYDSDVVLYGNSLFQPGQVIYINPTVIGLSAQGFSTRLSSVLGIGGYHQVISVDNEINENNYETILNTKWVASGTGPGEYNDCEVEQDYTEMRRERARRRREAARGGTEAAMQIAHVSGEGSSVVHLNASDWGVTGGGTRSYTIRELGFLKVIVGCQTSHRSPIAEAAWRASPGDDEYFAQTEEEYANEYICDAWRTVRVPRQFVRPNHSEPTISENPMDSPRHTGWGYRANLRGATPYLIIDEVCRDADGWPTTCPEYLREGDELCVGQEDVQGVDRGTYSRNRACTDEEAGEFDNPGPRAVTP
tara:strand:- start:221 stop:2332 length:2112 start_codon:yes stop_codon:yes gene_type:complete